ncbi:hypothetical protein MicloDRAFT_00049140 [Microvirga lotononidis]|uniref:Uncharacterized protein n=1 Tax=Microvirga lotononidis TaxID=864069 RepID=I4YWJ0_9HYPH|nr:hypothetical protein MicloDRAFT_00049140 [Microvirga lotononidis]
MRIHISACTDRVFAEGLLPMAHLTESSALAVNDNALRSQTRPKIRLHLRRSACLGQHAAR